MVHHDRLSPYREANNDTSREQPPVDVSGDECSSDGETDSDSTHGGSSVYEPSDNSSASDDSDVNEEPRRYPARVRVLREIPGAIPWDAVEL